MIRHRLATVIGTTLALLLVACSDDDQGSAQDVSAGDTAADFGANDTSTDSDEPADTVDEGPGVVDPALVGSYDVLSFTTQGQEITRETHTTPDGFPVRIEGTLELGEDGYALTIQYFIDEEPQTPAEDSVTWGVTGDRFTLLSDDPEAPVLAFTYLVEGDRLTLTGVPGNAVDEMILERTS